MPRPRLEFFGLVRLFMADVGTVRRSQRDCGCRGADILTALGTDDIKTFAPLGIHFTDLRRPKTGRCVEGVQEMIVET